MWKILIRPLMIFIPFTLGFFIPQAQVLTRPPWNGIKYILMLMLFLTFLKVSFKELKLRREHVFAAAINLLTGIVPWLLCRLLLPGQKDLALAAFFTGITPTAAAAPVVVSFLNGRTGFALTGFLMTTGTVSLSLLFFLPLVCGRFSTEFFAQIALTLFQIILIPFLAARLLRFLVPASVTIAAKAKMFSFCLWSLILFLISASACSHFSANPGESVRTLLPIGLVSALLCFISFHAGGKVARRRFARETSQILGQKNTSFTLFLSLQYANPVAAMGPIIYIVCHNTWNAIQMFAYDRHRRNKMLHRSDREKRP